MTEPSPSTDAARPPIDISRRACPSPHSLRNKIGRLVWQCVWLAAFRPTPVFFRAWRVLLLRLFGARMGRGAKVMASARIWAPWNLEMGVEATLSHFTDCYSVDRIVIADHATVSQYSFLCAASHDVNDPSMRLITAPITIGPGAWVCADVFVAPGVTIGEGAVVGVRSSVFEDMPPWMICAGHPCRPMKERRLEGATGDGDATCAETP